ncbi:MAG TPA: S46 family peptidase [Thermoanaerobaculia bacterium]|nr:S46 family peptidase [Thermoanaerobaculia bacterium]
MRRAAAHLFALVLAGSSPAVALEGKWLPEQLLELAPGFLREQGLALPPEALWSREGGGLLEAAIRVAGCSAGFVSAEGLVVTNHHCAFPILQQHSTPERDLIAGGFLAAARGEELAGPGVRATVPHATRDVSAEIERAVPRGADDLARFQAIDRKSKALVAECERQPSRRCEVAAFDGGVRYLLVESLEYPDVRLVYAPPRAVGEYGGEIDNWSWPRHTGDFALLRVYATAEGLPAASGEGAAPYRPRHHFPIAPGGAEPGAFVLVAGYPNVTYRSLIEAEMRERGERFFPARAALYRSWIDAMEAASARDEGARIALADRLKTLANREKNARGQVAGLQRGRILEKKAAAEREVEVWAAARPDWRPAVAARRELTQLVEAKLGSWERDFLLEQARNGPKPLDLALTLVRWAREKTKPDLARQAEYMERNRGRLEERLRLEQKRMHSPTEETLLADVLGRFAALPDGQRVAAVDALLGGARAPEAVRAKAADLLARTRVSELDERMRMFAESAASLRARRDPLLDLAFALDPELAAWEEREERLRGAVARLRPAWRRAVQAHAGRPLAPDANATLRVSLAHVQGYAPRDGLRMEPQTRVAGVVEKHTGEEPFDAPAGLLAAAPAAPQSRWASPALGDVPVCFLADGDTTGGSSGSPLLNGRGELVGVNFDRVWENVANDFGWNQDVGRLIAVDVRYLLWALETLHGPQATPLLQELGAVHPYREGAR